MLITLDHLTELVLPQLEQDLANYVHACELPAPLHDAVLYALTNGGKRVRPLMVLATCASLSPTFVKRLVKYGICYEHNVKYEEPLRRAMVAVECIHAYSLIHDDMPCMDDDDLRRGKPTTHIVFGEATALLAGDVLQSMGFEALHHPYFGKWGGKNSLDRILAPRARRMVAGQMLDLNGENLNLKGQELNQTQLEAIHRDKTGALIEASILMGWECAKDWSLYRPIETFTALEIFAQKLGLAFQVQDDILDVTADTEQLGKPAGSDEKLNKSTYVKLLGVDGATQYANQLFDEAKASISHFYLWENYLRQLADWLWARQK